MKTLAQGESLDLPGLINIQVFILVQKHADLCNSATRTAGHAEQEDICGGNVDGPHTRPPPHLAADAESLQRVEAEPARVSCLSEAAHELCVERPLQGRQAHQDHMFLFRGQLVSQDVMTSSGKTRNG